jgi:hypothetical protein
LYRIYWRRVAKLLLELKSRGAVLVKDRNELLLLLDELGGKTSMEVSMA